MSEDELIKTIKEKTDIIKSLCTDDCINKSVVIEPLEYSIQGLLDLYKQEKEKNKRNKKIMIDKLDKLKNGVRNDFPITLGKQQPLWEDNYTNYISKDKIRTKIKELEKLIETNSLYEECWNKIEVLKELLEEK